MASMRIAGNNQVDNIMFDSFEGLPDIEDLESHKKMEDNFVKATQEIKFSSKNEFEVKDCVVCMEAFKEGEKLLQIPSCRHFFHKECILGWLR